MWIWRPILAGHVTLAEVKNGTATIDDLQKLNALLDMKADIEAIETEKMQNK